MEEAWQAVDACFGRFCLTAGIEALQAMMAADVGDLCGKRHARAPERRGHRWGRTRGKIGYHGGKADVVRPRVRGTDGEEMPLPSWTAATIEDWLGKSAMNLMLIGVATRKIGRAVRLPEGPVPRINGDGTSKSAASRRFVALSQERMEAWLASDISKLDLLVIQIDGLHVTDDIVLIGAIGIDGHGEKHILGLVEGATENAAATQALLDKLVERGLDPAVPRLFILDGAKALSKAVRATFGQHTPIQRCQVHKARNIAERCPKKYVASVRTTLRKAWEMDEALEAERLIRDLAKRIQREAPGVSGSILEGLDEILTVTRLRLPPELRRSLACTNAIENMQGTIRRVTRNVKRWRDASMALRWAAAGMMEAQTGFRRLK
jgi:transposase-like protein